MDEKHIKILYVDDDLQVSGLIKTIFDGLYGAYYRVEFFEDGKAACEVIALNKHDVYLIGMRISEGDGAEIIARYSAMLPDKPFIMIAGSTDCTSDIEAMKAGASDFLPIGEINAGLLERTIRYAIASKKNEKAIREGQAKLRENEEALLKLNESKDLLLSVIGHDLRAPLGSIIQLADLLLDEKLQESAIKNITADVRSQATLTLELLDNILFWVNSKQQKFELKKNLFDINQMINMNILLYSKNAALKFISLENSTNHENFVHADENMINTVIRNLLSNAVKFTHTGGKVVLSALHNENRLNVTVTDNGTGMSKERADKILGTGNYQPLNGTHSEKGTGIGLKLCRAFVEMHGGNLMIESDVGKGTTVNFTIPG